MKKRNSAYYQFMSPHLEKGDAAEIAKARGSISGSTKPSGGKRSGTMRKSLPHRGKGKN